jgi:hypothetical protein
MMYDVTETMRKTRFRSNDCNANGKSKAGKRALENESFEAII